MCTRFPRQALQNIAGGVKGPWHLPSIKNLCHRFLVCGPPRKEPGCSRWSCFRSNTKERAILMVAVYEGAPSKCGSDFFAPASLNNNTASGQIFRCSRVPRLRHERGTGSTRSFFQSVCMLEVGWYLRVADKGELLVTVGWSWV